MMDELKKMMAKKGKPEKMDQSAIEAKLDVIKELLEMAQGAMAGKVKDGMGEMQKVSVMAPDSEGLAEGLDMASDVVGDDEDPSPEMAEHEGDEVPEKPEVEGMASLMSQHDEPEEEENIFAKKRMMSKRS